MKGNEAGKDFSFVEGASRVMIDGAVREVEYNDEWTQINPEGYQWRTLQYENTDKSKEDGAIVRIKPGGQTPIQINLQSKSIIEGHRIWDSHLSGNATLLICSKGEKPQVRKFGKGEDVSSYTNLIEQGTIMCWFADPDQGEGVTLFESEIPGFESANLSNLEINSAEIEGQKIPQEFWEEFHKLDTGKRFDSDGTAIAAKS